MSKRKNKINEALFQYLLRLSDDRLILGHRLSEWCGHGPVLEEDIAMANMALDLIGFAAVTYEYAGELEAKGRDQDQLAYFRNEREYTNIKMVELPVGDYGFTVARQFLFSAFSMFYFKELSGFCKDEQLNGLAAKALKESIYHLRHSREWLLRLGDGTEESHNRIQSSVDELWMYTGELFYMDELDHFLINEELAVNLEAIQPDWEKMVHETLSEATLTIPGNISSMQTGGRKGIHTEHLGYLLAEMQILPRTYPDAVW